MQPQVFWSEKRGSAWVVCYCGKASDSALGQEEETRLLTESEVRGPGARHGQQQDPAARLVGPGHDERRQSQVEAGGLLLPAEPEEQMCEKNSFVGFTANGVLVLHEMSIFFELRLPTIFYLMKGQ